MARTKTLGIRLEDQDLEAVREEARKEGRSMSSFVWRLVRQWRESKAEETSAC